MMVVSLSWLMGEGPFLLRRLPQSRPAPRAPAFLLRTEHRRHPCVDPAATRAGSPLRPPCMSRPSPHNGREHNWPGPMGVGLFCTDRPSLVPAAEATSELVKVP